VKREQSHKKVTFLGSGIKKNMADL